LPRLDGPYIGFVDVRVHLHLGEIFADVKEVWGLKRCGNGLSYVEVPGNEYSEPLSCRVESDLELDLSLTLLCSPKA
jgi:hypothetical protein